MPHQQDNPEPTKIDAIDARAGRRVKGMTTVLAVSVIMLIAALIAVLVLAR